MSLKNSYAASLVPSVAWLGGGIYYEVGGPCYGLNIIVPQRFMFWMLGPQRSNIQRQDLEKLLNHEDSDINNELVG